jgi:AcrR family transcriptional regulator
MRLTMSLKAQQSESARTTLIQVARALFTDPGYAETPTEEIVRRAGMMRGALYHQYEDEKDLFRGALHGLVAAKLLPDRAVGALAHLLVGALNQAALAMAAADDVQRARREFGDAFGSMIDAMLRVAPAKGRARASAGRQANRAARRR